MTILFDMKIKIKFITLLSLPFLAALGLFTSCEKQEGKYAIGDFMVSFGVIVKNPETAENNYQIRLDNGDQFVAITSSPYTAGMKAGQRVLVNFAPFDDKINADNSKTIYGKINLVQNILYKEILPLAQTSMDSIGKDPVIVRESWITGDSILTIGFNYYKEGAVHLINLVDNAEGDGKEKPFILELRHNAKGDQPLYRASGYVSFKLNNFKPAGEHKVDFYLRYTDYEGRRVDLPHSISY